MNIKTLYISILFLFAFQSNTGATPQFFIKISPEKKLVKYGKLDVGLYTTKLDYVTINDKPIETSSEKALKWINNTIVKDSSAKVLFFIHGFWGSLPYALHFTSKTFNNDYFKTDSFSVKAIIHIMWDASGIIYKQSLISINESYETLSVLLNNIDKEICFKTSLMCHSMGNRLLYETISNKNITIKFSELILIAPDLDYRKFEKNLHLFSALGNNVYVFYHKKDLILNISKRINDIERLGRISKYSNKSNISFIDCTNIKDDSSLDKFNNHLYFLTSKTVISRVEKILNN